MNVYTVTHHAACGMPVYLLDSQDEATREEARARIARRLRSLRAEGFPVTTLDKGERWEIGEPEDSCLIPDDSGILVLREVDPLAEKYGACRECDSSAHWEEGGRGEVYCLNCVCPDCYALECQCSPDEEEEGEETDEGEEGEREEERDEEGLTPQARADYESFVRSQDSLEALALALRRCYQSQIPSHWAN